MGGGMFGGGFQVRPVVSSGVESLQGIANSYILSLVCLIQMKMQSAARFQLASHEGGGGPRMVDWS